MGQIITVNFRGADLYGFETDEGPVVAIKPIVESIGLAWNGQFERLKRDPILSKGIRVMRMPFGVGGGQDVTCLRLRACLSASAGRPHLSPLETAVPPGRAGRRADVAPTASDAP